MIKIQNKLTLGFIASLLGELVIMLINQIFLKLGLVQSSLSAMALQTVKSRKWLPFTTKRDLCLSWGISFFLCTSGGLLITRFLSSCKRFFLLKGFILGTIGGIVPYLFKKFKLIKDFKKPLSRGFCFLSHGFFGLTVALVVKSPNGNNCKYN